MMAVASLTTFAIGVSVYYHIQLVSAVAFLVICMGFVASSRIQAKAHNAGELILGTLIGIIPQVGLWYLWLLPSL